VSETQRESGEAAVDQPEKYSWSASTNQDGESFVINTDDPVTARVAATVCLANQQSIFGIILMNMMQQRVTPFDCQTGIPQGRIVVCDRRSCV
jgi:hypothetical protein